MFYFEPPLWIAGEIETQTKPNKFRGLKTMGRKSNLNLNPNPLDPKFTELWPETAPLPSSDMSRSVAFQMDGSRMTILWPDGPRLVGRSERTNAKMELGDENQFVM